jgi:hypothetical protein
MTLGWGAWQFELGLVEISVHALEAAPRGLYVK